MNGERDAGGSSIGIMIAVGVRLYREGLARFLREQAGFAVKGVTGDKASALDSAGMLSPDIILLDTGLPDRLAMLCALLEVAPASRVIALAVTETDTEVIQYARAGVSGYVTREGSFEELVETIRSVACGEFICPPSIAALFFRQFAKAAVGLEPIPGRLTSRELQIAEMIDSGLSNKEIAERLNIEVSTVKTHVHHILEKLGAAGRGQAAARLHSVHLNRHRRM